MTCRGGPCARPHPHGIIMSSACAFAIHVANTCSRHSGCGRAQGPPLHVIVCGSYFTTFMAFPPFFIITTWPGFASLMRWPWRL